MKPIPKQAISWLAILLLLLIVSGSGSVSADEKAQPADKSKPGEQSQPAAIEKPPLWKLTPRTANDARPRAMREPTAEELAGIRQLFEKLIEARKENSRLGLGDLFDIRTLMRRMGDRGALIGAPLYQIIALRLGLEGTLRFGGAIWMQSNSSEATAFRLGKVRVAADGSEAKAFVHFVNEDGLPFWQCTWLVHRHGQWRFYDVQNLTSAQSISGSAVEVSGHSQALRKQRAEAKRLVDLAQYNRDYGDYESEDEYRSWQSPLRQADRLHMHPLTAARRWLYAGQAYLELDDAKRALLCFARARKFDSELPGLSYYEVQSHQILEDHKGVVSSGRAFVEEVGADAEVYEWMAAALVELDRKEEAADAYRAALAVDPQSVSSLVGLAGALPAGKKQELAERFQALANPAEQFAEIAASLYADNDHEGIDVIVEAFRKLQPDAPSADFFAGRARLLEKKFDEAAELMRRAIPRATNPDDRTYYLSVYHEAMVAAHKGLEAYRESDQPQQAFQTLAGLMLSEPESAELRKLIAAHQKQFPRDPWAFYYLGEVEVRDKHPDKADAALAEGMRSTVDAETLELLRTRRVSIAIEAGRGMQAYQGVRPRRATFVQLARHYTDAEQVEPLNKLLAAHRAADADDPALKFWQAEAAWLVKDYEAVASALTNLRFDEDDPQGQDRAERLLILSLLRLKRFEEAELQATQIEMRNGDPWQLLLVNAVWGRADEALKHAKTCIANNGYRAEDFYADPDLGPALRTPPLAKFRAKVPEPPKERDASAKEDKED